MELKFFETPGEQWDEFATRYTDLIFYQSIWSRVLKEGLGGQPLYFYLKEGEEIVAGLPSILLDFKIIKVLYASIPYGHLIGEKDYYPPFLELLDREFKKMGIGQVRIIESPFSESFPLESFHPLSTKSTLLDLRGLDRERIWEGYKKNIRRDIRKAQRSGMTIREGRSQEGVDLFYKLYLSSMERNKAMAKYPLRWFKALYEWVTQRGLGEILLAELGQKAIAGVVLIYSPSSTHYFHNGSQVGYLTLCPNELLIHYSLGKAIEKGGSYFDFMGTDPKDLSLLRFKEKWGGQSRDIYTYVKNYHPIRCNLWETGKKLAGLGLGRELVKILGRMKYGKGGI
jgi:hypothetical protein